MKINLLTHSFVNVNTRPLNYGDKVLIIKDYNFIVAQNHTGLINFDGQLQHTSLVVLKKVSILTGNMLHGGGFDDLFLQLKDVTWYSLIK